MKGREGEMGEKGRARCGREKEWKERQTEGREEGKERGPQFEKNDPPSHQMAGYGPVLYVL